jgi:hypothetical protein
MRYFIEAPVSFRAFGIDIVLDLSHQEFPDS